MTYVATVLADNPLHYWRLADPGGIIAHDIGSSPRHLVANNANPQFLGYSGMAADGGSAGFVDTAQAVSSDSLTTPSAPISVECWYWPFSFRGGIAQVLFSWDSNANPFLNLQVDATGHFHANMANASAIDSNAITIQHWHYLVGTYSVANGTRAYTDGVLKATTSSASAFPGTSQLILGANSANFASGWLAEVAVYSTELTSTQVSAHFAAQELSGPPVYQLPGTAGANGSFISLTGDLSAILDAVSHTFPAT